MAERVFIVAAKRTAFGTFGGALKDYRPQDLAAELFKNILKDSGIAPEAIDQVHLGCCVQCNAEDVAAPIIARQAHLKAGIPHTVLSSTVDRACTSASYAVKLGMDAIRLDEAGLVIVGGTEVLSHTPYVNWKVRYGARIGSVTLVDPLYPLKYADYEAVAIDAANVALEYGVSREMQDQWAYRTQMRYQEALKAGKWEAEIMPIEIKQKKATVSFSADEFPKANTTLEGLASLPTVFGSKTVTAGNAPGLNDGACAMILASESRMKAMGLKPMAELLGFEHVGGRPDRIAEVPGSSIKSLLAKHKLTLDDIKLIEINEAFSAMPLVSSIVLGENDPVKTELIREKINVNGGSVAMGHPVGCSGARIVITLLHELIRRGGGYGTAAICGGLAQGDSILIKV